jgi:FKBP-type peptidyl-prolyl cis-trans isomerase (trigger factor)
MNPYNMDESKQDLVKLEALFNAQVDTQVILQLLIDKGICTRSEINLHREKVKELPKYKATADYIKQSKETVDYYNKNPEQHLRDIFKAKMDGKIK